MDDQLTTCVNRIADLSNIYIPCILIWYIISKYDIKFNLQNHKVFYEGGQYTSLPPIENPHLRPAKRERILNQ